MKSLWSVIRKQGISLGVRRLLWEQEAASSTLVSPIVRPLLIDGLHRATAEKCRCRRRAVAQSEELGDLITSTDLRGRASSRMRKVIGSSPICPVG